LSSSEATPSEAELVAEDPEGAPDVSTSSEPRPLPVPTRTLSLFVLLLAIGSVIFGFAWLTVHRQKPALNALAQRESLALNYWLEHGYFSSGGLTVRRKSPDAPPYFYRSSTGGRFVSGFIVEKIYSAIAGHYSWRLLALHNQILSLLTATLLALLGFRMASRAGMAPFHALVLAISVQAVHFTFPDNLALYFEMTGRECWFFFVAIFLLLEEHCQRTKRTRILNTAQAVACFFFCYMEYVAGVAFVVAYTMVALILSSDRATLRRVVLTCVLPLLLALGIFAGQRHWVTVMYPNIEQKGNGFFFRSGLDGSTRYYVDHLDIAFRRDTARMSWPETQRARLFRWTWLFLAGTAAFGGVVIGGIRSRVPKISLLVTVLLLASYLIYAAFFSQAIVIHPYLYDVLLFTPLVLALFVVVPSWIESASTQKGVAVFVTFFLAVWVSMVQMRDYAVRFPPEIPEVTASTR